MKRVLPLVGLLLVLSMPGTASATPAHANFVGSGCSISTCRYFTSSYSTAHYHYDRRTCRQWSSGSSEHILQRLDQRGRQPGRAAS